MSQGITVDFNANLARFTGAIDRATNDLNKFQSNAQRVSANLSKAFGALGVGLSVGGVVAYGKAIVDLGDEMNDLSQRVGINIKDLATWQLAASQSGTSIESVAKGVKGLSTYMVENGAALKKAGINATDANGAMIELADLFKVMPDGVEKTALAVKLFGKAGMDMIPMLNLGSEGLKEAQEKAKSYGERLAALAPKADAFNDQMAELALQSKAAGMNITDTLLPGLIGMATWLNDLAAGGKRAETALEFLTERSAIGKGMVEFNKMFRGGEGRAVGYSGPKTPQGLPASPEDQFSAATDAYMADAPARAKANDAKRIACTINGGKWSASTGTCEMPSGSKGKTPLQTMLDAQKKRIAEMSAMAGDEQMVSVDSVSRQYATKAAADNLHRLNDLLAATPTGQLQKAREEMQFLAEALEKGPINEEQFAEAVGEHYGKASEALEQMNEFAIEAARGIQDAFADFLFDPFSDKTDSMLEKFGTMLRKMAAQAAAAQLSEALFGDMGKTGKVGGIAGDLLKGLFGGGGYGDKAGLAAGVPQYAQGTPWVPNDGLAYLHKGEQVIPVGQSGGGGVNIVVNNTAAPDVTATASARSNGGGMEIEVFVQRAIAKDMARNGPITQGLGSMFGLSRAI